MGYFYRDAHLNHSWAQSDRVWLVSTRAPRVTWLCSGSSLVMDTCTPRTWQTARGSLIKMTQWSPAPWSVTSRLCRQAQPSSPRYVIPIIPCVTISCLFACLISPSSECVRGSYSIEHWAGLSSPVFRPSHGFLPVTFLFGFWIRNLPVSVVWALLNGQQTKKVFFLIWQSTNAVICFGQVKSYARLDSELTLIFRRLPARP